MFISSSDLSNGSRYNLVDDSLVEDKKSDVNGACNMLVYVF